MDGSAVIRHRMSVHTPEEIERTRRACQAGVWMQDRVPDILRPGLTERELFARLTDVFRRQFGVGYDYRPEGGWKSVFLCTQAVVPHMLQRRRGAIVNISSVLGFTRAVGLDLARRNIRVNAIAPGSTDTPLL